MFQHAIDATRRVEGPATTSDAEWRARVDLAAAYRLAAHYSWDDLIYTHISSRVPGNPHHFLINPFRLAFREVTAGNLVKIDEEGRIVGESDHGVNAAGFVIHSAVHRARPELNAVMHTHSQGGMALSMLPQGLLPVSQHALMFYKRIGYHKYEGIALGLEERERLISDLGPHKAMILHNHGLLTAGRTMAEAFVQMFNLEKAAAAQLAAMAASRELVMPAEDVSELTAVQHNEHTHPVGDDEWPSLLRMLDRIDPGYKN
jgi:ribulose-5-phosphate 4-epimerase/fuculose-1-phosphate aldolase